MDSPTVEPERAPSSPRTGGNRSGVIHHRSGLAARLNSWRKRSALNPYWLGWRYLQDAVQSFAPTARGRLLDVGVAERPYADLFEPHVDRYVGLDYPPVLADKEPAFWDFLEVVRRTVDVFGDGHRLPFRTESFDTVLCIEVLEHLPHPRRCLAEIARVMRPGALVLVTVPMCEPHHFLPGDYYRFTRPGIEDLFAEAGLELESVEPRGNITTTFGQVATQWILRVLVARSVQTDGSVIPGKVRQTLLLPVIALVQLLARGLARLSKDESLPLGYRVVGRKP